MSKPLRASSLAIGSVRRGISSTRKYPSRSCFLLFPLSLLFFFSFFFFFFIMHHRAANVFRAVPMFAAARIANVRDRRTLTSPSRARFSSAISILYLDTRRQSGRNIISWSTRQTANSTLGSVLRDKIRIRDGSHSCGLTLVTEESVSVCAQLSRIR